MLLIALPACAAPSEAAPSGPSSVAAQLTGEEIVGTTRAIAATAGRFSTPSPAQPRLRFYGTDLGWAFPHGDELWMLFGDSWVSALGLPLNFNADDAIGKISLRDFPDGDAVERWIADHPSTDRVPWRAAAPPLAIAADGASRVSPLRAVQDGRVLASGEWLTPVAGFSNARSDASGGAFGVFFRNEHVECSERGTCEDGFECDAQLGRCAPVSVTSPVCILSDDSDDACSCVPVGKAKGLCIDKGSSMYDPGSARGRGFAAVVHHQVGNALRNDPSTFATQPWATHRFFNLTARTVNDFDPERPHGEGNDYGLADGDGSLREGVFVWGRPNFVGLGAKGRDAQLYLAWVPMPAYDHTGHVAWAPRHFAGLDARGVPQFTQRERDGVPLDLDADTMGVQPEEALDVVNQMSISWLPSAGRFVMLYGGDSPDSSLDLAFGDEAPLVKRDTLGAIFIRFAPHPWGPWTSPRPVFVAGDVKRGRSAQYGPGGILHHPRCTQPTCAPSEPVLLWLAGEPGRLYAPSIIEPWTEARPNGSVDLYWNVSTWNPYQVVLMKTHLGE